MGKKTGCLRDPPPLRGSQPPKDKYNAAYIILFILGAGFLLPWNGFLSAVDYFTGLYPDVNIESLFSAVYMPSLLVCVVITIFVGQKIPIVVRIVGGYALLLVIVLITMFIQEEVTQLVLVLLMGFGDAIVQGTLYGLAGQLPPAYTGGLMTGIGAAGIITALIRIITKLIIPDARTSFLLYFGVGALVLVLCIILFFVFQRLPIVRYYRSDQDGRVEDEEEGTNGRKRGKEMGEQGGEEEEEEVAYNEYKSPAAAEKVVLAVSDSAGNGQGGEDEFGMEEKKGFKHTLFKYLKRVGTVFWVVKVPFILVFITFTITISLFPGLTSVIKPQNSTVFVGDDASWFPVILVAAFQVFDFIGRMITKLPILTNYVVFPPSERHGYAYASLFGLSRVVFVPIFIFFVHPRLIVGDVAAIATVSAFALSNGYIGSVTMMMGPEILCRAIETNVGNLKTKLEGMNTPALRELAGTVMGFGLMSGLTAGAICGAAIVPAVLGNTTAAGE
uniref:Uncharacterized protein n=1 Tax=Palpitomonas bilix TaxID=652834 RepID=A0A7S3GAK3_9EUKA|mmetsp:Transcript_35741/g.93156  ORF Transcript_35741/g.93156 Transcript_35741/m.93156 type:complete len:502 (+) Transcript_35741:162-1667(+)